MALKGTLKDFGIADILQLIGQQTKTGVLYIKSKADQVEVSFVDGNVVRAQSQTRRTKDLLGNMLVSSGLLTEAELANTLEIQRRTLKRLGDILVAEGKLTLDQLRDVTQLQTTETLYTLFGWKNGTYEFVQQDVEFDPAQGPPVRPESVLMEGFRRIDEWPMVRKRIPSLGVTFERRKHLDPPPLASDATGADVDAALDAALDAASGKSEAVPKSIGKAERLCFKLADPELTAQRIADLSRLGEFEASKALFNLVEAGYLEVIAARKGAESGSSGARMFAPEVHLALRGGLAQTAIGLLIVVLFAVAARALGERPVTGVLQISADARAGRRVIADVQMSRLRSALEVYRLRTGEYPLALQDLAGKKIVADADLQFPFEQTYHYRRDGRGFVLLPPLR